MLRNLSRGNTLTTFETMRKFPGSSKIYGRSSPVTRFVHNLQWRSYLQYVDKYDS